MRNEYPHPQQKRNVWQTLNGQWQFHFDDYAEYDRTIQVPFAYQSQASGIADVTQHDVMWYKRTFVLTEEMQRCGNVRLNFNAVDWQCQVFVNGQFVVAHEGGYSRFGADITPLLQSGAQTIEIRVYDPMTKVYPRGKQNWEEGQQSCWYYCTSGIWQSVWLDGFDGDYATDIKFVADVDKTSVRAYVDTQNDVADELVALVTTPQGKQLKFVGTTKFEGQFRLDMAFDKPDPVNDIHMWSVDNPNLYQTVLQLKVKGSVVDEVETYFAFRKVHSANGKVYVNDLPIQLRMLLNQGYWDGYGMTAPSAESFRQDIQLAKDMGFNGFRMHQKVEDPYLAYYADTMGFFIWAETPSAYEFRPTTTKALADLQMDVVARSYNSPSVIAYVPFNESWGVKEILRDKQQQALAKSVYWLIKSLDDTRLVVTNDGWENLQLSDIIAVHDYSKYGDDFADKYTNVADSLVPMHRRLMAEGEHIDGQPILLTEFGGIALASDSGWGYFGAEPDEQSLLNRLEHLLGNVADSNFVGWCYTQFTDVEQETNGLLDAEHQPKVKVSLVRQIVDKVTKKFC